MKSDLKLEMRELITGFWLSQAIYVAAKLGVADTLIEGEKEVLAMARECKAHPDLLYRLLRALASKGIFEETKPRHFRLTPKAQTLRSDADGSLRHYAIMYGEETYRNFGSLHDAVATGDISFPKNFGMPFFDYLERHPDVAKTFHLAMVGVAREQVLAVADAFDFSQIKTLVDVGGGSGPLLFEILRRYPQMKGVLFDLPEVIAQARDKVPPELKARCQFLSGSFFDGIPQAGDTYLMKSILHDWGDEPSLQILRHCRKAIPKEGQLLVVDQVVPRGNEAFFGKLADLHMHVLLGGKERTEEEFEALFKKAGFTLRSTTPTSYLLSILRAAPLGD